ncbi:hypothetical protein HMPREF1531_01465 [Propionibacterium sp. oral taxon 192 str. F0372]|uniref:molybdopterin molybdotransferase MoeA n=1 Tax=Propionibacterium sp. oral taxon 192 TaxID=671222 RepID=UPI000353E0B8|nr:gephyrin-like molybdotransferase Glp [Propionibacterium sp. oral taxon 192]EPH03405.1 hypothetical protein HMPREF1531_01465 [Propionibacterium sp. oral taxon 192 str. F0372]
MALFKRRAARTEDETAQETPEVPRTLPAPPPVDARGRRSVEDQRDYLLSLVEPLPAFGMYLLDAWGTAVCEDIVSDVLVPASDLAAVSGYAVRAVDLAGLQEGMTTTLKLRGDGQVTKMGAAARVSAGAEMPEGADAVLPASQGLADGDSLLVDHVVLAGDNVRRAGTEVRPGVPIMQSGQTLDARRSALLALAGVDRVMARPRPRVVVLSLLAHSDDADAESHLLAAALKADGAQVWRVALTVESERELRDAIADQLIRADLVVATGSLDADALLPRVVAGMGLTDTALVAIEPGEQIGFGLIGEDEIPLVMLPDDPVASYVDHQFFVRPLVRKLMGAPVVTTEEIKALIGSDMPATGEVTTVSFATMRAQEGEQVVVPLGQGRHLRLLDMVGADAVIVRAPGSAPVSLGERVRCLRLND